MNEAHQKAVAICELLDEHLKTQERQRHAVSRLAAGGAFEAWLAFETRLLIEHERKALGLLCNRDYHGAPAPHFWTENEGKKMDLALWSWDDRLLVIELKLIHNNKNQKGRILEVVKDLLPTRTVKRAVLPEKRVALVAIVGKVYRDKNSRYPCAGKPTNHWKKNVLQQIRRRGNKRFSIVQLWQGRRLPLDDPWLKTGSFFQLFLLGVS